MRIGAVASKEFWGLVRLEFVELWKHQRKTAQNISSGMQRRLQLATAVVHQPELLFVDESTANLDPILRRRFWGEVRHLANRAKSSSSPPSTSVKPSCATAWVSCPAVH